MEEIAQACTLPRYAAHAAVVHAAECTTQHGVRASAIRIYLSAFHVIGRGDRRTMTSKTT